MNWREACMMAPVAAIIFYIGLHPAPLLRRMEPRLQELIQQVQISPAQRTITSADTAPAPAVQGR
jgi:NADH:ubiquinone oxidoreductase subunit 4 (subunit M)